MQDLSYGCMHTGCNPSHQAHYYMQQSSRRSNTKQPPRYHPDSANKLEHYKSNVFSRIIPHMSRPAARSEVRAAVIHQGVIALRAKYVWNAKEMSKGRYI
jgi:hypothetical protein